MWMQNGSMTKKLESSQVFVLAITILEMHVTIEIISLPIQSVLNILFTSQQFLPSGSSADVGAGSRPESISQKSVTSSGSASAKSDNCGNYID